MWLINTTTLKLEEFITCPSNQYAILSHTWEKEELDFETFKQGQGRDKEGFKKIMYCCRQAQLENLKYAWIDTCCIDKRSSTELSEAINSMYSWYAQATICYAYLADVNNIAMVGVNFLGRSRWFTRGWTLQELLAPSQMTFYSSDWTCIGSRYGLKTVLSAVTRIDKCLLTGTKVVADYSVAQRMSWAARRTTTRTEDSAYCLLGIFNVNMPLMYGEGSKAFLRLQHAIIQQSDDETIFAWTGVEANGSGMFAKSTENFVNAGNVIANKSGWTRRPYSITNHGLEIECQLLPYRMNTYLVPLHCSRIRKAFGLQEIAIFICRTETDRQYQRIVVEGLDLESARTWEAKPACTRVLYIPDVSHSKLSPHGGLPVIRIHKCDEYFLGFCGPGDSFYRATDDITENEVQRFFHNNSKVFSNFHPALNTALRFEASRWRLEAGFRATCTPNTNYHFHCLKDMKYCNITLHNFSQGITCCACHSRIGGTEFEFRVGFNCDFEPVCFWTIRSEFTNLVRHLHPQKFRRLLYSTCMPRPNLRDDAFSEFDDYLNLVQEEVAGGVVRPNANDRSLLVLRGHRKSGFKRLMIGSWWSQGISFLYQLEPWFSISMTPASETTENGENLIWDFKVTEETSSTPLSSFIANAEKLLCWSHMMKPLTLMIIYTFLCDTSSKVVLPLVVSILCTIQILEFFYSMV